MNNEQSEKKITKTISVIVVSKRKKYLRINQGGKRVVQWKLQNPDKINKRRCK